MSDWFYALQTYLGGINRPMFGDADSGYLLFTVDRVLLAFLAVLMVDRVVTAGLVLIPRPHVWPNVWYWLRWWFLLLVVRDFDLKLGGAIVASLFLTQVVIGSAGAFTTLTWYLFFQHVGAGLLFFGIARWATRLRKGVSLESHEP